MTKPRSEFNLAANKVLFASAVGIGLGASPIPFISIGHLVKPLNAEFGWNRQEVMTAVTCFAFAVTLLSPFFGSLVDRFGVRKVAIVALALFAMCWMSITLTTSNVLVFYAMWLTMGILGGASIPISWTRAVNAWFVENRGLALAVALSGTGFAGIYINAIMPRLNESYGWRGAVIGLGLSTVLIGLPIVLWLFREPRPEQRPAPSDKDAGMRVGATTNQAMGELRFWLIIVSVALVALAYGGLYSNYVPLLMDKGYDAKTAGGIAGVIGISIIVGRLVAGYLIDRFWAPFVAFPMLALQFLVCWQLRAETVSPEMATVCACLIGLAAGIETDIIAYLAARYYGLKNYGKIYGILYMPFGLATAISAPLYGWVFDQYKTYNPALFVAAIFFVLGGLLLLLIGKYPDLKEKYGISST